METLQAQLTEALNEQDRLRRSVAFRVASTMETRWPLIIFLGLTRVKRQLFLLAFGHTLCIKAQHSNSSPLRHWRPEKQGMAVF